MAPPIPPPSKGPEDWDAQGRPNRQTAFNGPPRIQTSTSRARGRGRGYRPPRARAGSAKATGSNHYPSTQASGHWYRSTDSHRRPPPAAHWAMDEPNTKWSHSPSSDAGPSNYYEPMRPSSRRYSPSNPVAELPPPGSSPQRSVLRHTTSSRPSSPPRDNAPILAEPDPEKRKKLSFKPTRPNGEKKPEGAMDRIDVKLEEGLDAKTGPEVAEEGSSNAVDDMQRREGVLAFQKDVLPKNCFAKNPPVRKEARSVLQKQQTLVLRAQGRKLTSTLWRDDGVGYSWVKMESDKLEPRSQPAQPDSLTVSTILDGKVQKLNSKQWAGQVIIPYPPGPDPQGNTQRKHQLRAFMRREMTTAKGIGADGQPTRIIQLYNNENAHRIEILWKPVMGGVLGVQNPNPAENGVTGAPPGLPQPFVPPRLIPGKRRRQSQDPESTTGNPQSRDVSTLRPLGLQSTLPRPTSLRTTSPTMPTHPTPSKPAKRGQKNVSPMTEAQIVPGVSEESAPSRSSEALLRLEGLMAGKITAIDNWTHLMSDYPERGELIGRQVERTQEEIFRLLGEIEVEKRRLKREE